MHRPIATGLTNEDASIRLRSIGLCAGAIGFTSSRSPSHETPEGRLVASRNAEWNVVRRLVNAMRGRMFAQTHSRSLSALLSFKTQMPFDRLPLW